VKFGTFIQFLGQPRQVHILLSDGGVSGTVRRPSSGEPVREGRVGSGLHCQVQPILV